jgi:hypothetical protein
MTRIIHLQISKASSALARRTSETAFELAVGGVVERVREVVSVLAGPFEGDWRDREGRDQLREVRHILEREDERVHWRLPLWEERRSA